MSEFEMFDGTHFIIFNIVDLDMVRGRVTVAISNLGKISVCTFELKVDGNDLYFEYGVYSERVAIDDFEVIERCDL